MSNDIILGIFTGNHAGAEVHFGPGEYIIGSAAECDVVLTDSTLAPRHCSLSIATDGTTGLTPMEGKLALNGKSLADSLNWQALDPVLAGMVCLAWMRPGQSWAGLKLPSLLEVGKIPAEAHAEAGKEEAKAEVSAKISSSACMAKQDDARLSGKSSGRSRRLVMAGAIILLIIGLTISVSPSGSKNEENRLQTLRHLLLAEGFADLRVEESAGRVVVYGLAPTKVDANRIRSIAAGQSYPVQVIVRDKEEFSRAILAALAERGIFPQVRLKDGEAVLSGYALDKLTEIAALSWARGATPPVATIRSALLTRDEVEETLTAELTKAGLQEKYTVKWRPGVIALSGEPADKDMLAGVIEKVRGALSCPIAFQLAASSEPERIYAGEAPDKTVFVDLPGQQHAPDQINPFGERFSLRSVTPIQPGAAVLPFITTSDGAVYFLGGTLPSGHILTGIHADRLEFSRNGSTMAYKLQGR